MKLDSIQIKNYRSIKDISFEISAIEDKSYTYGLIGINEAGKSSILKGLALKDGLSDKKGPLPRSKDFKDDQPIEIMYSYNLNNNETNEIKKTLIDNFPDIKFIPAHFEKIILKFSFNKDNPIQLVTLLDLPTLPLDGRDDVTELLKQHVINRSHKTLFWTAEDKYLITEPVNLSQFADDPNLSIPLRNCFSLIGLKEPETIKKKIILSTTESTERELLIKELSDRVTEHINLAWPGHKIKITFDIYDGLINFHIHDLNTLGKAKTTDQRSDGFGQFISFLLSVSAQNVNEELKNTLVLIDEPETHLHPQAQEDMLRELIKITRNERNNVVFFATHSNYLIDKSELGRNYRISKLGDITEKEQLRKGLSTYASVTYEVFGIASGDYHNELYDVLREKYATGVGKDPDEVHIKEFDNGFFIQEKKLKTEYPYKGKEKNTTLPTYIRNAIHYPENRKDDFEEKLRESIELLKSYE